MQDNNKNYDNYLQSFHSIPPENIQKEMDKNNNEVVKAGWYNNFDPNVSVRPPMTWKDYEFFRPDERIPYGNTQESYRRIMNLCNQAYESVGVIRSVIDLMSEFTIKGIDIVHEDEGPSKFYKAWQKRVKLEDRAERFASSLYRRGATVVRRKFGQLDKNEVRKMQRTNSSDLLDNNSYGRIPLEYVFYNPANIEIVGGILGTMSGRKIYAIRLPVSNLTAIASPKNDEERKSYNELPEEIKQIIDGKTNKNLVGGHYLLKIPEDKIYVANYKKDDFDLWGKSFIYSILRDVFYNEKLHLAKTAALDSWTNVVRIWNIGDSANGMYMTPAQRARLASILQHNTGGGGLDIIWGDDLELKEFYPPMDKISNINADYNGILLGLGIADVLVGGQTGSGQGSNIIGLKNLITRIACGRRAIKEWIEAEIDIIQRNMGFNKRPFVRFTYEDLHDERTYFNLLVQLLDRNVISDKTVLERINEIPDVEMQRISEEEKSRSNDTKPEKASPFHNPTLPEQRSHEIKKIKLQEELKQQDPKNRSDNLTKQKNNKKSDNGRPPGSRDNVKRLRGPNKIRSPRAQVLLYADKAYNEISDILTTNMLESLNIKDVRSLTSDQKRQLDQAKIYTFSKLEPFSEIDNVTLNQYCQAENDWYTIFNENYINILNTTSLEKLTEDQKRMLRIHAYVDLWCINIETDDENIST